MRLTRIFVDEPLAPGGEIVLPMAAASHVSRVLRLTGGDPLILFNGQGGEYTARVVELRSGRVCVSLERHEEIEREAPFELTLAQGVSRGERMDWVIQKATELGVHAIAPILTERSVVKLDEQKAEAKRRHWRAVAIAACEQCGRNRVPEIETPMALAEWLARPRDGARLVLGLDAATPLASAPRRSSATLLIGPEGGLTPQERLLADIAGFKAYRLGPRVLRAETAAIVALSVLQSVHGDLGR